MRFPAAALAHQPQRFPLAEREADTVHRADLAHRTCEAVLCRIGKYFVSPSTSSSRLWPVHGRQRGIHGGQVGALRFLALFSSSGIGWLGYPAGSTPARSMSSRSVMPADFRIGDACDSAFVPRRVIRLSR